MKKILITGANSYIGTSFEKYIKENFPGDYTIDTVDMIDGTWREKDFSGYDTIFHVAAIVHRKENKKNAPLYYTINRDFAVATAKKAKNDGARQFIFLSSMSVYGVDQGAITKDTTPHPQNHYGKSKLEAEDALIKLADNSFFVCILRLPMVYGKGCKGKFDSLCKLTSKLFLFPKLDNKRSMIYTDNLSEFVRLAVCRNLSGIFWPQNKQYTNVSEMVSLIAAAQGKRMVFTSRFGVIVEWLIGHSKYARKAFGSLYYDLEISEFIDDYNIVEFARSVTESASKP